MESWAARAIDRIFAIDGTSPGEIAMLEERIAAIQPRMVWLYLLMAIYFVGLALVLHNAGWTVLADLPLGLLIAFRIRYWLRHRDDRFRGEGARSALRGIALGAIAIAISYFVMLGIAVSSVSAVDWQLLLLSASICALASAVTIATVLRAGLAVLLLLGLPASLTAAAFGPNPVASMIGLNLFMCTLLSFYMLKLQDHSFVRHYELRLEAESDRLRAERAEQMAVIGQTQARAAAESDVLTGLPNRRAFMAALGDCQHDALDGSVMILDLDGFKPVNDIFGHPVGDELLKLVSGRLCKLGGAGTFIARLGGDEFALLAAGLTGQAAEEFAEQVVATIGEPYLIGSSSIAVGACCGVATLTAGGDASGALREADLALYRAKSVGRGTVQRYERSMGDAMRRRTEIELALRKPGIEQDIELAFQPIFDLETMDIVSFEALARWSHSTLGPVSPADFIPITEQIQLVEALSNSLLSRAVDFAKAWPSALRLSFNLSAVQLCSLGSAERLLAILAAARFPPTRLQIEVTETAMMANLNMARVNIEAFRAAGVEVVLDDFGAGFALIGYLRELRFDALKLDGSLVTSGGSPYGGALLKGVIDLATSIGTPCIAEHVETIEDAIMLRTMGCRFGQGYWLGRPVRPEETAVLAKARIDPGVRFSMAS